MLDERMQSPHDGQPDRTRGVVDVEVRFRKPIVRKPVTVPPMDMLTGEQ
jgi:hypothetical protein